MEKTGTLYFFTGLAGAGKTTIGSIFFERLKLRSPGAMMLDGDWNRVRLGNHDYSTESRLRGARRLFLRCKSLTDAGTDVVCCSISMYREIQDWNRANIPNYRELYIKVSMDTLYRRDQRGLYSSGARQVVGVDLPYDEPEHPDMVIENEGDETPEQIADRLERRFLSERSAL